MAVRWRAPLGALFLLAAAPPAPAGDIYRWTDDSGHTHFGDQPPPEAERIGSTGEDDAEDWRTVERVLDGDTFHLTDGEKVRLIGVNAPEVAHRDDPAEPGGPEARRFLERLLADGKVRLEAGQQARDRYDRLLAYVYTEQGSSVAAELLRRGHAHVAIHPPNTGRIERYLALEAEARAEDRGIWGRPRYRLRPVARAKDFRNTFRRLRGEVAEVRTARKYVYVTFAGGLIARLDKEQREAFAARGRAPRRLVGRSVVVRGWVQQRDGRPHLSLRHPAQIEAVR